MPKCRVCGVSLDSDNRYPSRIKKHENICIACSVKQDQLWQKENPKKKRGYAIKYKRKQGERPFNKNKECPTFLGVHVAERVLSKVFKDVERMPMSNPGYDFICNKGKRIDIKSSCTHGNGGWSFHIERNTTADFFLLLAFDNREDLNPLHAWLIPGSKLNHLKATTIKPSTIHKWDAYRLDISKISDCCNSMR